MSIYNQVTSAIWVEDKLSLMHLIQPQLIHSPGYNPKTASLLWDKRNMSWIAAALKHTVWSQLYAGCNYQVEIWLHRERVPIHFKVDLSTQNPCTHIKHCRNQSAIGQFCWISLDEEHWKHLKTTIIFTSCVTL